MLNHKEEGVIIVDQSDTRHYNYIKKIKKIQSFVKKKILKKKVVFKCHLH